jgi:hypothetical protein
MTECTKDGITFSSQGRRQVTADFCGGDISSDAGVMLLREAERGLGLIKRLSDAINDPRDPARITHEQETLLKQRVLAIALGYEDLNDHTLLRNDTLLKLGAGATDAMGSSPTLCRLENRVDRKAMWAMAAVLVDTFIKSFGRKVPKELILDFDATDDPTHGKQEGHFFHGYYDQYCFLPLYVFCGGKMLVPYLRPSNIDAAKHARAILALLVKRLRAVWPKVRIVIRADSGFCRWRMLRWCDTHDVNYIVGLARNSRIESLAGALMLKAAQGYEKTKEKQRLFGDIQYAAETWNKPRRVIAKAEHMEDGPNPRFIVTNLKGDAKELYDTIYCARGEMENRIKEQQLGLFADRTSCHKFVANQFRVLLSAAAYVLVEHIRSTALKGTALARAQVTRIRLELFKIGARVLTSVRRIVIHLATACPAQDIFKLAASRLMAASSSS